MTFQRDLAWQYIESQHKASVASQVGRYAAVLEYDLIPEKVVHQAKRCVLDALGCALGALDAPGLKICEAVAGEISGPAEATVFGSGARMSALSASLVNSFLVRFLDFNDLGGGGHNSDAISSILAVAEREGSNGKDFLTSVVISYELGERFENSIGMAALEKNGWTQDIRAGFNQPPALGKLMKLDADQMANAIGICLSHTLPMKILDADQEENMLAKNLRYGWAAHDAIISCMLAQKGFTGPLRIIEGDSGIASVIAKGAMNIPYLVEFSGWRIMDVQFKAMAVNFSTQGHLFATLSIVQENDLMPDSIASIRLKLPQRLFVHTTTPAKKYPRNAESADHSAYYSTAMVIRDRKPLGSLAFKPDNFTDPVVLDLIEKISVEHDPGLSGASGISEITTTDGRMFQQRCDAPLGSKHNPAGDTDLEAKFMSMASRYMAEGQANKLMKTIWSLERLENMAELARLMCTRK